MSENVLKSLVEAAGFVADGHGRSPPVVLRQVRRRPRPVYEGCTTGAELGPELDKKGLESLDRNRGGDSLSESHHLLLRLGQGESWQFRIENPSVRNQPLSCRGSWALAVGIQ